MAIKDVLTYSLPKQNSNVNVTTVKSMPLNKQTMGLAQQIDILSDRKATGNLVLNSHVEEGKLHLFYGRLLYTTSNCHRVRRWQRAIALYCSDWNPQPSQILLDGEKPWEYLLLYHGIIQKKITISQAKKVMHTVTLEVLFSLSNYTDITNHWEANVDRKSELSLGLALCYREIEPILSKVTSLCSSLPKDIGLNMLFIRF